MGAYLVRRFATLPLMLLGISAVSFALLNLAPGDPAEIVLRQRNPGQMPSPAAVSAMRTELGLDASLPAQYVRWMSGALSGDMGRSYVTERPVAAQLARRTVPTVLLTAAALSLALLVAVPVGILSAQRRGGAVDAIARLAALVGAAVPSYALAFGLIILFAVKLSWLPALGYGSVSQIVLPAIGATGVNLGYLLSGAVIVETIFTWPGLGQLIVGAALTRDYPVVQGFVAYIAVVVLLANLAADIALRMADPRLRYEREEV